MRKKASKIVIATSNLNYIGHTYFHETWHEGLVGILASRIKDEINRPVIVFAPSINPLELKGSGRSIPNFHLRDALDMITKKHPSLIVRFGGHAMAAGLTIKKDYLEVFRQEFDAIAKKLITSNQLHKTIITDGHLEESITLAEAEEILSKVSNAFLGL